MRMGKSASQRKSDSSSINTVVKYGLQRVTDWTRHELAELQKTSKLPICVELTSGDYLVATYLVEKLADGGWKVDNIEFNDKRCAIFYCALTHLSKFKDADDMMRIDKRIGDLESDKQLFRDKLDKAHLAKDQFRIDLFSSRFDQSKGKLALAKLDLEKTILRAKYIQNLS
jgi:hypothetical protein